MIVEPSRIGKRGTVVIPSKLRRRYGLEEGTMVIAEEREDGILLRPAVALPVEIYTDERKAEFLLTNSLNAEDYAAAAKLVREEFGLDPETVPHIKPPGV